MPLLLNIVIMETIEKKIVICENCGKQFETVDDATICPECEGHWIDD